MIWLNFGLQTHHQVSVARFGEAKKIRDTIEVTLSLIRKLVEATGKETMSTGLHR